MQLKIFTLDDQVCVVYFFNRYTNIVKVGTNFTEKCAIINRRWQPINLRI